MSDYHYLVAGLPEVSFHDGKLPLTVDNFREEIYPGLTGKDKEVTDLFYLARDNRNLLSLLKDADAPIGEPGCYTADELKTVIDAAKEGDAPSSVYPTYFYDFIQQFNPQTQTNEQWVAAENLLASLYYNFATRCKNKFVASWFTFNLNVNNILVAATVRKYKLDINTAVVGDNEVCAALRTSLANDFGLASDLDYVLPLLHLAELSDLSEREELIDLMRWNWLDENSIYCYFSIEKLFAYLLQLDIKARWTAMDKERGEQMFRRSVDALKSEIKIPDEFIIK